MLKVAVHSKKVIQQTSKYNRLR